MTAMVRNYYNEIFHNSALHNEYKQIRKNVYELSEFLVNVLNVTDFGAYLEGEATFHDSCAAIRECKIGDAPRELLANVKGLQLKEMDDAEMCCGFGGSFSVKFEPLAVSMTEQKVEHAVATGAKILISTDLSCLMHMDSFIKKQGKDLKVMHLADVLASGW
jgi:L-lactate dehydrogenase complex protein LldE